MQAGEYLATVADVGIIPDKDLNPMPAVVFEIEGGETIKKFFSLKSEKGAEFAVKAARTLGFTGSDWNEFKIENMDGRKVMITVVEEEYNGKKMMKVQWINDVKKTMSPEEVKAKLSNKALFAKFKAKS